MNEKVRSLLLLPTVLFLIAYFPLPMPLKLLGFVTAPLAIYGLKIGGQTLLIGSPLLACWISLAYFSVSPRVVGTLVLGYMLSLLIVLVVFGSRPRQVTAGDNR